MGKRRFLVLAVAWCLLFVFMGPASTFASYEDGFYLVGDMNGWEPDAAYQLRSNGNGEYRLRISLNGESFKVCQVENGEPTAWYPDPGESYSGASGRVSISFRPDYDGGDDWFYHVIRVVNLYDVAVETDILNGAVAASATSDVPEGETVTLTANPDAHYALDYFTVNGAPLDGDAFPMPDENVTVGAVFQVSHVPGEPVYENEIAANCTAEGSFDEAVYCSICGEELSRVVKTTEALGHEYEAIVTEPTCTAGGYTTYTCTRCGDSYTVDETEALGHDYEAIVTEPTCSIGGYTTYTCTRCGDSYTADETEALGHDYEAIVTEPTCTAGGYTTYTCTRCGDSYTADETETLGHDYVAIVTEPTCTAGGYTTYTCTRCGDSYTGNEIDALGHDYVAIVTEPTCTAGGYTTYTCTRCGDSYTGDETDPLDHDFGPWTVITPPTETEAGEEARVCTRCDAEQTQKIDALGPREGSGVRSLRSAAALEPIVIVDDTGMYATIPDGLFNDHLNDEVIIQESSHPEYVVSFTVEAVAYLADKGELTLTVTRTDEGNDEDLAIFQVEMRNGNGDLVFTDGNAAGNANITVPFRAADDKIVRVFQGEGDGRTLLGGYYDFGTVYFETRYFSTFTVQAADAVASVNGYNYATLADAIASVSTDGTLTTVTMIADHELEGNDSVTVLSRQHVDLDLNGCSIQKTLTAASDSALITNDGTLTIRDSSGCGQLAVSVQNPSASYASSVITNHGTLTIEGGSVMNFGSGSNCFAVDNRTDASSFSPSLTIAGGSLQQSSGGYAVRMYCSSTTNENAVNIISGSVEGLWLYTPNAEANRASLNINGGAVYSLYIGGTPAVCNQIFVEIYGGEIQGTGIVIDEPLSGGYGRIEIGDGTIENITVNGSIDGFILGGRFNNPVPPLYCASGFVPDATIEGDTTVYGVRAGWKVTFEPDNGDDAEIVFVDYDGSVDRPDSDPMKANCEFDGWYLNGVPYDFAEHVTDDITLRANWISHELACNGSLTLSDSIDINIYVYNAPADAGDLGYYALYTVDGAATRKNFSEVTCTNGKYVFTKVASFYANQLTKPVTFAIYDGSDQSLLEITYSVQKYCDSVLGLTDGVSDLEGLKKVCRSLMAYGYYAQQMFPASKSADIDGNDPKYSTAIAAVGSFDVNDTDLLSNPDYDASVTLADDVTAVSAALSLQSWTELNLYFYGVETMDPSNISVTVDGASVGSDAISVDKLGSGDSARWRVAIKGLRTIDLTARIEVKDSGSGTTVVYSPMSYIRQVLTTGASSQANENVSKALYNYCMATRAYFLQP